MNPVYEGKIVRQRLYIPSRLDDVLFALRLEQDCFATFLSYPVPLLALRHIDVFLASYESLKKDFDKDDVFENVRYFCGDTQSVKRYGRHLFFHERSLEHLSVGNKSPVCLDVIGENLIVIKKEDWQKYVACRLIDSK